MTKQETFDQATRAMGGRLDRERLPALSREYYLAQKARCQDLAAAARNVIPTLPEIHIDYIFSSEINAVAFKQDGQYFIGLTTGALFMIRQICMRMLSDPKVFSEIGEPDLEDQNLPPMGSYIPHANSMLENIGKIRPRSELRFEFARFLTDQAIMFLAGHELTHIIHGHVDYLAMKRNKRLVAESALPRQTTQEEFLERQCLELLADRRSIISRVDSMRFSYQAGTEVRPRWRDSPFHPSFMLAELCASVSLVCNILAMFDIRDPTSRTLLILRSRSEDLSAKR
jgi:hypothetical protein